MTITDEQQTGFRSLAELRSRHMQLLERADGAPTPDEEFLGGVEAFVRTARATGAILEDPAERRSAQTMLDYWTTVLYRARRASAAAVLASFDPSAGAVPRLDDVDCPYPGARAFRKDEAEHFFGRELLVTELAIRLRGQGVLVITGPLMSGKTSFLMAGLLPALESGRVGDSASWRICEPIEPGPAPLQSVARALSSRGASSPPLAEAELVAGLRQSRFFLRDWMRTFDGRSLLAVDQLEVAFANAAAGSQDHRALLDNLVELARDLESRCYLVMLARTESNATGEAAEVLLNPALSVQLPALGTREMRDAILQPAELLGLKFDDGIVADLISMLIVAPQPLPMLQFALRELWLLRDRATERVRWVPYRQFLYDEVRRRPSAPTALARAAGRTYTSLASDADKRRAQRVFLALVEPGDSWDLRFARVRRASVAETSEDVPAISGVVDQFARAGVLRVTDDGNPDNPNVELTHESLPRYWGALADWLRKRVADRLEYEVVRMAANDWTRHNRPAGALWSGTRLRSARVYRAAPDQVVREFIVASQKRERVRRQLRQAVLGTCGVLFVIVLALIGILAKQQGDAAEFAVSRDVAGQADLQTDRHLDLALLLGINANKIAPTQESQSMLLSALESNPYVQAILPDTLHARVIALSPDGRRLAAVHDNGSVYVWDLQERGAARELAGPHQTHALTLTFNADGSLLMAGYASARELWRVETGEALDTGGSRRDLSTTASAISSTGLLALAGPQAIQLRQVETTSGFMTIQLAGAFQTVSTVAFSPDGSVVAVGGRCATTSSCNGGAIQLFDTRTGQQRALMVMPADVVSLDLSSSAEDPLLVAAGAANGSTAVWSFQDPAGSPATHHTVAQTPAGAWLPRALALRAGGHQLLVGRCWTLADDTSAGVPQCSNADIQRWDVDPASDAIDKDTRMAAELQRPIAAHLLESQNIAMAVGGERVAMANRDSITVWDLSDRQPTTITHTPFSTLGSLLARDPQQTTVAAVACDGEQDSACPKGIVLLHAADGTPLGPLLQGERHKGNVTSLVFNSDGTSLASAGDDGVLLWDVPSQRQVGQRLDTGNVVRALAFGAPQGRQRLALVDDTRTVTLWDPDSGRQVTTPQRMQTDATLRSLAFSTDGQLLAAGTDDGRILLWDPATGELALPPLTGQFGQVRLLGFTAFAGMRLLASVDQANQITVWDVDAGRALASPPNHHEELVTGVDFHTDPNSHDLVMVSHDTQNDVSWTLQLDEQRLQQRVCTLVWRDLYPEEKRRFLHLDFPFPSSVVEPWFFSFEPVSCPGPGAPTTS